MLTTMSWAVAAWPPVGGLGGRIAHKHPHTPSTSTNAHIRRLVSTRTWTHAQKPTHYLNSLDLTLLTTHLPDNSHSDFLRDEKCFRATRRLVFFSRVRTPCGHGAQVIVEGREKQPDGGENNKNHKHNPKTTTEGPKPSHHHHVVFPLC